MFKNSTMFSVGVFLVTHSIGLAIVATDHISNVQYYEFSHYRDGTPVFNRSVGTLYSSGAFYESSRSTVSGFQYAVANERYLYWKQTWDYMERISPGWYTYRFKRSVSDYYVYYSSKYIVAPRGGDVSEGAIPSELIWLEPLQTNVIEYQGYVYSAEYGFLSSWEQTGWIFSGNFGWTHYGSDETPYNGFVWTERFGWMRFFHEGGEVFLWVSHLRTWVAVQGDGSFFSFDFGYLTPIEGSWQRYSTAIGNVTASDRSPSGWLESDRFGFVWFARETNGTWFWSASRNEWLGITPDGGIWSVAEQRFI